MPRFSANLGFLWPERPLPARIEAAARAGFRAVELHWPQEFVAREIAALNARLGLRLLGINTSRGSVAADEFGLGAVPGAEPRFRADFDATLAWARAAGARAIHVLAGNVPPAGRDAARAVFAANLRWAAPRAAAHGLALLLEPLNPHDHPGYFYAHVADAVALIDELALPNVRLQFDAYHVGRTDGDPVAALSRCAGRLGHVQIAAVPTRAEPDEGTLDYRGFFAALRAVGYDDFVGCEYRPRADTDTGLAWCARLGVDLAAG
jgi:hydroxypyruvate isomerase